MTCRRAGKALPLLAGGDLSPRRDLVIRAHLRTCPACRKEFEEFRRALETVRTEAREEPAQSWSEPEWKALMARVRADQPGTGGTISGLRHRWAWAAGAVAVVVLACAVLIFKNPAFRPKGTPPGPSPHVVSVTLVSQETGLQVVWFLNKDFDWKGDEQ